jgi:hypothetical protein
MYQSIDQEGDKKSTYTYYINVETKHPVHYEMFGYDTLIGSHFDKYTIDYYNYDENPIDSSLFHITDGNLVLFYFLFLIIIYNLLNRNEMYRFSRS